MANIRQVIVVVALVLVVLSVPPIRRRLPGVRRLPAALESLLWLAFAFLCVAAVARVQDRREIELLQAVGRAALNLGGQVVGSLLEPAVLWVSAHQPGLSLVTAGAVGIGWVCIAARAATVFTRAAAPRPRLGDWWELRVSAETDPRLQEQPVPAIVVSSPLMDAHAAAAYLGVSPATVYRWARTGRLRCAHAGKALRFSPDDLAVLRHGSGRAAGPRRVSVAR